MIDAGIGHIGLGVLTGLADWRSDWTMLMQHEAYLNRRYGVTPSILGIPRLKPARAAVFKPAVEPPADQKYRACVALRKLFSPYTQPFISTREHWDLCVELSRGGGCLFTFNCSTTPGGYSLGRGGRQFDTRSFDAPAAAEALRRAGLSPEFGAGLKPGSCAMHDSCDSYCVVEHNGDVYPCDFFVREEWKLGNVNDTSFDEIARRTRRLEFAARKSLPHSECEECEYASICRRGCPKLREGRLGRFEDLDYFCQAYKTAFRVAVPKLRKEVEKLGYRAQN